MGELISTGWDALLLEPAAFLERRGRRQLAFGLALMLTVSLVVGLTSAAAWAGDRMEPRALRESRSQFVADLEEPLARSPLPLDVQDEVLRNLAAWYDLQGELEGLPRPLGQPAGLVLAALERAASAPYRRLAVWLPYTLVVFGLARALGGRATLQEMLGATALYAAPHVLDVLGPLPWVGPVAGLIATVWGAAIYVRATATANRLGMAQALVAVLAPAGIVLAVVMVGLVALLVLA